MPDSVFDMVRCGIATYGLYPSKEVEKTELPLTPALEWKTQISYSIQILPIIGARLP